jgi:5-hydroxyisourate hydrolase
MGLSTHVLDTMHGRPAGGMEVALYATKGADSPLLDNDSLQVGTYRLVFSVKPYFKALGVALPEPSFLDQVTLDFGVADTRQHYHVPLLVSPWSFSTYRGS